METRNLTRQEHNEPESKTENNKSLHNPFKTILQHLEKAVKQENKKPPEIRNPSITSQSPRTDEPDLGVEERSGREAENKRLQREVGNS